MKTNIILLCLIFLLQVLKGEAKIIYVSQATSSTHNGSSWTYAYNDLQDALTTAQSGDTVWVAQGTYFPTSGTDRTSTLLIPDSVKVFGGFGGFESPDFNLNNRNFNVYETVLSGEIGDTTTLADNSYHVVQFVHASSETVLDGFTVKKGYAQAPYTDITQILGGGIHNDGRGSGMSSNPKIINCFFKENSAATGGGLYNDARSSGLASPDVINCKFFNNTAANGGAAANNADSGTSSPRYINCVLANNQATALSGTGGAVLNYARNGGIIQSEYLNCTFYGNTASSNGQHIMNQNVNTGGSVLAIVVVNSILVNSPLGQMFGISTNVSCKVSYTLTDEPQCTSMGLNSPDCQSGMIYAADPLFENPPLGSFRLNTLSPAKNMGSDMALVYDTDLDLKDRRVDGHVDLGAFESQILITKYFVDASQNGGSGVYWNDALPDLQKAIYKADAGDSIWVAHGIYLPTSNANRNIAFQIPNGVKIFGGFQGNETETSDLAKRDFKLNETILSGNIGSSGTDTDNSYHVVYIQKADSTTLLNGLTIADGNADQTDTENFFGAGLYNNGQGADTVSNPTLELCVFKNNKAYRGGGIYNNGKNEGQASPWISHCRFISNTAVEGAGAYNNGSGNAKSNVTFSDCVFENNFTSFNGAAIYNYANNSGQANASIDRCVFSDNESLFDGGAIYNRSADFNSESISTIKNSLFVGNQSTQGSSGAIHNLAINYAEASAKIYSSTFYGNSSFNVGAILFSNTQLTDAISNSEIENCIFYGNGSVYTSTLFSGTVATLNISNSLVSEPNCAALFDNFLGFSMTCGGGMIYNSNPLFRNASHAIGPDSLWTTLDDGLQLKPGSPALEKVSLLPLRDLSGRHFKLKSALGAYEYFGRLYVRQSASGENNGESWPNAFVDLQDALKEAATGAEVWVAEGTYKPTQSLDRTLSFVLPDSVKIYGGFAGNEPESFNPKQRNFASNISVLSGEIGIQGNQIDNTYHVVYSQNVSQETLLDGFNIKNGYAAGTAMNLKGAGWLNVASGLNAISSPEIKNCVFQNNYAINGEGAAICNFSEMGGIGSPRISECNFSANTSYYGGAVINYSNGGNNYPLFVNCSFSQNSGTFGGAMANISKNGSGQTNFLNCTFYSNSGGFGGAIYNEAYLGQTALCYVANCIFNANTANSVIQPIYQNNADLEIMFSLVDVSSCSALYSGINSSIVNCGQGMIYNQDPLFVNTSDTDGLDDVFGTADDGLRLQNGSPAINQASNMSFNTDRIGQKHINTPDLGAYENPCPEIQNISSIPSITNQVISKAAVQTIQANNLINPTSNVYYLAGNHILLSPGFEAKSGNVFEAVIEDGCH
ncbi:hypothetical protein EGI22_00435 [Lacihabitans sp. LS3-19]|uniref:3-coathanger stack domain-containing protein n=1 Tax=Lacihabitans sp. LS3-19 TaxID=2487335 RepID=UPI0020CCF4BC|nr:3-coathanger stack domain-containing protein [Lacihabitans sp. LS3-19]MCP9766353.1 hypothetical protein [Lacihabitans sp. LS3-19]